MDIRLNLGSLRTPTDIQKLVSILSEMADSLDVLYSETAPNGAISGRQGQICLYNNSGTYTVWICTGSTVWQQVDGGSGSGDISLDATSFIYFGASGTNGSWRIGRDGNNLVVQRRESGSWVAKGTFEP